jgi:hypothetical protein
MNAFILAFVFEWYLFLFLLCVVHVKARQMTSHKSQEQAIAWTIKHYKTHSGWVADSRVYAGQQKHWGPMGSAFSLNIGHWFLLSYLPYLFVKILISTSSMSSPKHSLLHVRMGRDERSVKIWWPESNLLPVPSSKGCHGWPYPTTSSTRPFLSLVDWLDFCSRRSSLHP